MPGDKFTVGVESFLRFMPLISPVMHRINLRFYAFFVPNRLITNVFLPKTSSWQSRTWEDFITGGSDGVEYPAPELLISQRFFAKGGTQYDKGIARLLNYLGYTGLDFTNQEDSSSFYNIFYNPFPFAAYFNIWNEYFRDQNLQNAWEFDFDGAKSYRVARGANGVHFQLGSDSFLLRKCWEKDYFTSSLPWLQRGNPADLPISFTGSDLTTTIVDKDNQTGIDFVPEDGSEPSSAMQPASFESAGDSYRLAVGTGAVGQNTRVKPTNLSSFIQAETTMDDIEASFTINDLRRAEALQRWMEKSARGGSRYIEQIRSFFGVVSSDARLQRPEFLGALSSPVSVSEVLQHSQTTSDGTPLGEMGGHALSATGNWLFKNKFFEEHGILMILACVQPRTAYYGNMMDRRLYKPDRFHYYWPDFARIGEQPVYKGELNQVNGSRWQSGQPSLDVFGYQERYVEYKQRLNRISGQFDDTLDFWHLGRSFDDSVALNSDFVECNPSNRVFAVENSSTEHLLGDFFLKVKAYRPVIPHVIPGL